MKKTILLILMLGLLFTINAQTITEIKSSSVQMKVYKSTNHYQLDLSQFWKIKAILKGDVFVYYDLQEQYDSDLKKDTFKESDDYKVKFADLEKKKAVLKETTYYLDLELPHSEQNYDHHSKSFTFNNEIVSWISYKKRRYMQIDQLVFKIPKGIKVKRSKYTTEGYIIINQLINFKLDSDSVLFKIKENRRNSRILFVFKFTDPETFKGFDIHTRETTLYKITKKLEKVIIYNEKTGEIYQTYIPK